MGRSASGVTTSRTKLVRGTSLVGMRYSAVLSGTGSPSWPPFLAANRSPSNLGSWPVPLRESAFTA
ncbi:hypothetical protein D3C87_2046210 [compost metagenome]